MSLFPQFFYPPDMSEAVMRRWAESNCPMDLLPGPFTLSHLLNTMYQASLMHEEGEPVRCRLILAKPQDFPREGVIGIDQVAVMTFENTTELTPHELRKFSVAAGYHRAMLAVDIVEDGRVHIWGMVLTGTRWVHRIEGGRLHGIPLPPNLCLQIMGPGNLIVASGYERVVELSSGEFLSDGFDPFHSEWLPERFASFRSAINQEVTSQRPTSSKTRICDSFVKSAAQSVIRRTLSLVRTRRHGGMLVYLPETATDPAILRQWIRFRATFERSAANMHYRQLITHLLRRLLVVGESLGLTTVRWEDYQRIQDSILADLDDALIDFAHLMADMMTTDGALVLDRRFNILGFGGEILGDSHVSLIHRALDLEANSTCLEPADSSGTRHRSAYRLVTGLPDVITVVVSQDGGVRFVAQMHGKLIYWPYLP